MMSAPNKPMAPIFGQRLPPPKPAAAAAPPSSSAIPSSSPAFGTPVHPLHPFVAPAAPAAVLPILLPPATLRPLAFRTFTKKHGLTLTSAALQDLAAFVGRSCGSRWREEGLADRVLEEAARGWKARNGGVIVSGGADSRELAEILKTIEGSMSGGKMVSGGGGAGAGAGGALALEPAQEAELSNARMGLRPTRALTRQDSGASFGLSGLDVGGGGGEDDMPDGEIGDVRKWLRVIGAFEQPRMVYNVAKKHFERETTKPSLLPPASHKTLMFRNRYNVIHQRLLRNEFFQTSAVASARGGGGERGGGGVNDMSSRGHRLTPIANMLGRHGSGHMLLGMLMVLPSTGGLALGDPTGTIALDLSRATSYPDREAAWFCPGMIVLVDGVYEEADENGAGSARRGLSGSSGIGGVLGGRFRAFFIGQPPCERRSVTLGSGTGGGGGSSGGGADDDRQQQAIGGGFGWIDFLGVGSERAAGSKMRRVEQRLLRRAATAAAAATATANSGPDGNQEATQSAASISRGRVVILAELNLDNPRCLQALRRILAIYGEELDQGVTAAPVAFVLMGSFTEHAALGQSSAGGSIEYKEAFDALASILAEFPALLRAAASFVFVPGDNDGWVSAFTAGAAAPLPRRPVPDLFTSRVRRTFAAATGGSGGAAAGGGVGASAVWTTNPCRISLFGPLHELLLFRDDASERLRRTAVRLRGGEGGRGKDKDQGNDEVADPDQDGDVDMAGSGSTQVLDVASTAATAATAAADPLPHSVRTARRLVKTILDQGFLAPFRQAVRPVLWDFSSALHLYPLPTAAVLADASAPPFCITYEGCHVMNPGPVLVPSRRGVGRWVEWAVGGTGTVRECTF